MSTLRQRKKDQTRARLIEVSQRLFDEQGYDATTVEQICKEAEVSSPTLLVYFASKERLALASDYDTLADFRAGVEDPARGESTIELWRAHVERQARLGEHDPRAYLRYWRFVTSSPVLVRGALTLVQDYESVVAEGLGRDFGTDARTDLGTLLFAQALVSASQFAVQRWVQEEGTGDLCASCVAAVDFVIEQYPRPGARPQRNR
ncbi:MAG TPA: TetR/AcrR family transcriptional regulator [Acidimicrobiales bacterium]|nr:TetR/AcrR family transcriptional regulator [Acidimicrobiales bacterium]